MRPKTMIAVAATVAVVAGIYAWREYDRAPASTAAMGSDITLTAQELLEAFVNDETAANARFNDKVVEVSGTVRSITTSEGRTEVVLETGDALAGIICSFESGTTVAWAQGDAVRVKGVCTGMLMDVVLVRCTPVQ